MVSGIKDFYMKFEIDLDVVWLLLFIMYKMYRVGVDNYVII